MIGPSGDRSKAIELVGGHGSLEDISSRQAICPFQVQGGEDLAMFHGSREVWSVSSQQLDATIRKALLDIVPAVMLELVRSILNKDR